jgi:hypothetical protein
VQYWAHATTISYLLQPLGSYTRHFVQYWKSEAKILLQIKSLAN